MFLIPGKNLQKPGKKLKKLVRIFDKNPSIVSRGICQRTNSDPDNIKPNCKISLVFLHDQKLPNKNPSLIFLK